ncbi:MAG: flagellar biosynthesis anti-sigma factor FlgM [SAR324 cluster bacterium]|jgi:flagellar biosynthesis anti-sigma factor FlgM|nr:flagellar biosynthesis anti-sigma factor FlgM [SAR324 cluster bacterium]MDP6319861.1 flagellar biosynthesis anti-sigma factor FlgM [SAR324 cluster bacterium]RZO46762.1 MAG: flagellar biosynthesis anti-sigma factor FlgM [Pseudomonadota bacterium]|tara:strand:+ start:1253 stop:1549 length:297 start_codon:yes stop_codon:yes gene_type:complete
MKITGQQPPEFHGVKGGTAKENQKTTDRSGGVGENLETPDKNSTFVMNKIKNRISTEPEVRADRVADLKAKIKGGEFKVDSQRLAKAMLDDALREDTV